MNHLLAPLRPLLLVAVLMVVTVTPGLSAGLSPRSVPAAEPQGEIIAQLDFDPKFDGFSFENYGNEHVFADDLTPADMIRLFGARKVCRGAVTAGSCVLTAAARAWMTKQLREMAGGHCEGMAVTSLRFLLKQPFKGKTTPAQFQTGAEYTFDLAKRQAVENYISTYFVMQELKEVASLAYQVRETQTPIDVLNSLIAALDAGTDPVTLGIYKSVNGGLEAGHAITPFAVEDMGAGIYRVHVYDNNYPEETRYVVFNTTNDTWRYATTTKPGEPVDVYAGNARTKSLDLTPLSARNRATYTCPFCTTSAGLTGVAAEPTNVQFFLNGEGEILIENSMGQLVGFDVETGEHVNEIAGTDVIPFKGGLGMDIPPTYEIPVDTADAPLDVLVTGKTISSEVDVDMTMVGPGLTVGVDYIQLDPDEALLMTMRPDGRQISFTASQDIETPDLSFALDPNETAASYLVEVGGVELTAGSTVTATMDVEAGLFYFEDDDGNVDEYDIDLTRVNADGSEEIYAQDDVELGGQGEAFMNFGAWNQGEEMCFVTDDEGDGYADDQCEALATEHSRTFLPFISR